MDARVHHLQGEAEVVTELVPLLQAKPRAQWIASFEAAGVPCAPIHSVPEALAHPQVQALGILAPVPGEDFSLTALPLILDGQRPALRGGAPRLGEHNAQHNIPTLTQPITNKETS